MIQATHNPYSKLCVPDVVKNMSIKAFNLLSRTNETCFISRYGNHSGKYRLDASVCNYRQHSDSNKCRYEWENLIDKSRCHNGFIWNPVTCECECDRWRNVGECLNCMNCKCGKKLIDRLVEKCDHDIDGNKMIEHL